MAVVNCEKREQLRADRSADRRRVKGGCKAETRRVDRRREA